MNKGTLEMLCVAEPTLGSIYQNACDHRVYVIIAVIAGLAMGAVFDVLAWLLYTEAADHIAVLLAVPLILSGIFTALTVCHRVERARKATRFCYRVCIKQQAEVIKTLITMGNADREAVQDLSDRNAMLMQCIRLLEQELEKCG